MNLVAGGQLLRRPREGGEPVGCKALVQQHLDLRAVARHAGPGRAAAVQPRRDHLGVVHHQRIAGAQIIRQVTNVTMLQRPVRMYDQHARGIARARGPERDQLFRQVEIEEGDVHDLITLLEGVA